MEILLYFLCSHVPIKIFFDGTDQENSETRGKGQIKKIQENKKESIKEIKRKDFDTHGGSHTHEHIQD